MLRGAALFLSLSFAFTALASPLYTVEELLPLPGHIRAHANAINESGQVVGYSYAVGPDMESPTFGARVTPTFWHNGMAVNLVPGARGINAIDINDVGQIVGFSGSGSFVSVPNEFGIISSAPGWGKWATVGPGSLAPIPSFNLSPCFVDEFILDITNTGYMRTGLGNTTGLISPHGDVAHICGLDRESPLYESGVAVTSHGYLYDPFVDTIVNGSVVQEVNKHMWTLVPSCTGDVHGYATESFFSFPGTRLPFPLTWQVSDAVAQQICDLVATGELNDKLRNESGQFILNVGDRAFLYTPATAPSTSSLLAIALFGAIWVMGFGQRNQAM